MYNAWATPFTDYCLCCGVVCHAFTGNNEINIKGKAVRLCDDCFYTMKTDTGYLHSKVVSRLIHYSVNTQQSLTPSMYLACQEYPKNQATNVAYKRRDTNVR